MKWVIEHGIFPDETTQAFVQAVQAAGHDCTKWDDDWWDNHKWQRLGGGPILFRGSLENAARVARELPWTPGSYCDVPAFNCSSWYPQAAEYLVHPAYRILPASDLVKHAAAIADEFGGRDQVFVRPDSPLKPFSGRVVEVEGLSLSHLDHGFYYEDEHLPVVVAPVQELGPEYRLVIVNGEPVAGSHYAASERIGDSAFFSDHPAWEQARKIAAYLTAPEAIYVMDLVESPNGLKLLELISVQRGGPLRL
ncbi:MAG: ATP-grasp domain-containing protein [Planctomycetota bacterium]